jgi:mannonate dehydratase
MRDNLAAFLREVIPVAEDVSVRLAINPDDPPRSLFGLPRIVSTAADARLILRAVDREANGLTLCAGSYGSRADNDVVAMAHEFAPRIHFAHLRNSRWSPRARSMRPNTSTAASRWFPWSKSC